VFDHTLTELLTTPVELGHDRINVETTLREQERDQRHPGPGGKNPGDAAHLGARQVAEPGEEHHVAPQKT